VSKIFKEKLAVAISELQEFCNLGLLTLEAQGSVGGVFDSPVRITGRVALRSASKMNSESNLNKNIVLGKRRYFGGIISRPKFALKGMERGEARTRKRR
jgi:hypothetical protein